MSIAWHDGVMDDPARRCGAPADMDAGGLRRSLTCTAPSGHEGPHFAEVVLWWDSDGERVGEHSRVEWGHPAR